MYELGSPITDLRERLKASNTCPAGTTPQVFATGYCGAGGNPELCTLGYHCKDSRNQVVKTEILGPIESVAPGAYVPPPPPRPTNGAAPTNGGPTNGETPIQDEIAESLGGGFLEDIASNLGISKNLLIIGSAVALFILFTET